jgi:hypothetical protein
MGQRESERELRQRAAETVGDAGELFHRVVLRRVPRVGRVEPVPREQRTAAVQVDAAALAVLAAEEAERKKRS